MTDTTELEAIERTLAGETLISSEAYRNLLVLCDDIGPRFGGTDGERRAADFIRDRLVAYGLQKVRLEEFSYLGWRRGPAAITVVEPHSRRMEALSLPYTPSADLEAELACVGQGEPEDYQAAKGGLKDKVVLSLAESTPPPGKRASHRREKYLRAVEAGAQGFLYVSQNPGSQLVTGSLTAAHEAEIPGVSISHEDGAALIRWLERGSVRVRLTTESTTAPTVSHNVIGDLPGGSRDRQVLVGAHYDSHDIAEGALDNASGTVIAMEAVRALVPFATRLGAGVRVVLFGAEEIGLLGSWEYVRRHQEELDGIRFMLNLDATARGRPGSEALVLMGAGELAPYFERMARDMNYPLRVGVRGSANSDHFPFVVAGLPTGSLVGSEPTAGLVGRGWGHTSADTVDKVCPLSLQVGSMLAARILFRLAVDPEWPGRRHSQREVWQLLEAEGLHDYLQRTGRSQPNSGAGSGHPDGG